MFFTFVGIMAKRKDILNLGDEYNEVKPFDQRESIAFLLGAGFSIPMGYPTGGAVNNFSFWRNGIKNGWN